MRCIVCKGFASTAKKSIAACKVRHLITALLITASVSYHTMTRTVKISTIIINTQAH